MRSRSAAKISIRRYVYQEVWLDPVIRVGERYGITGTALSKICRKAGIPVPPVGYWQRLQFGYKPDRPVLPSLPDGAQQVVRIEKRPPKLVPSPEAQAEIAREEDENNRVRVAGRLTRPHPLVRTTADAYRGQKSDEYGMLYRPRKEKCLDFRVSRESLPRALRIMDAFVKAAEARGFKVTVGDCEKAATSIELCGEKLEIALEERSKREDHVLTEEEQERKTKYRWSSAPRWDYRPSGTLQFQIKDWGKGARKTWSDGRTPIEEMLNDVIAGLIVVSEAKRRERLELQRQHEEWAEAERRRLKDEERRRIEAERLKALEQEAMSWTRSQQITGYVDAVEREALKRGVALEEGCRTHAWLAWARVHATSLDPVRAVLEALDPRPIADKQHSV
jgi:hypothetical protein